MHKHHLWWIVPLAILAVVLLARFAREEDVLEIDLRSHKQLALHIHPEVHIEIEGQEVPIPENIGVDASRLRVIHTHDEPNVLHVESPRPHTFILQDFFTVWGMNFNESCIFGKCVDDEHSLKVFVDGVQDDRYGAIPLQDKQVIRIVYGAN